MAANDRSKRWEFKPWAGVSYIVDPALPPDHFYATLEGVFHIGAGTDLQLRLFHLNLTKKDLNWLRDMGISLGNK